MKRITLTLLALFFALICIFCAVGCETTGSVNDNETTTVEETNESNSTVKAEGLWKDATYLSDVTIGEGSKTVSFTIEAKGQKITVTLKTDKDTLGQAMYEHELINDPSFFDTLNGMLASWDNDKAYWGFYQGETMMPYGVNDQKISGGESFRFVYTK
ncbi:MAG: DUF4430 domain-containing protein [Ruminococcaceae bacterium]|nr:DUF4430 domain-containing protein [Oscillospiraceae bacterium]MBE6685557.1 DUF4430 domain-containing protein [Oscillospiraceae bacterium]